MINIKIYIVWLLIILFFFTACSLPLSNIYEYDYLPIWEETAQIKYLSDIEVHNVRDYWQVPEETLELLTGDCEDFAIYFAWRYWQETGIKLRLVWLKSEGIGHMAVEVGDDLIEPMWVNQYVDKEKWKVIMYVPLAVALKCAG